MKRNKKFRTVTSVQSFLFFASFCALFVVWSVICVDSAAGQQRIGFAPHFLTDDEQAIDPETGAVLKTDPDSEASLETAERFKNDGNYRVATLLWQAALQRSGDALYSKDDVTYFSLVRQVEQILAELPSEGLEAYRVTADAEAKEILAEADDPTDVTALNRVVRQYFISSIGDDAAFQLGCIYLDRYDFIGARRMFEKIQKHYPDPSVDMDQVRLRIALCESFLGEIESANVSLEKVEESMGSNNQINQIRASLGQLTRNSSSIVNADWKMPLGDSKRYGVMPGVPDEMMQSDLVADWQYYFEPRDSYNWSDAKGMVLVGEESFGEEAEGTRTSTERKLISSWRSKSWRPAGQLLLDSGRIYFKSAADVAVWNAEKIANLGDGEGKTSNSEPEIKDTIEWRSAWRNAFEVDAATKMIQTIRRSWGGYGNRGGGQSLSDKPESIPEVQLFGDGIHQQMSIYKGTLFSIEGKRFNDKNRIKPQRYSPQWNTSFRRTRSNILAAYDAVTGESLWVLPRSPDESEEETPEGEESPWIEAGGFMAAPIGFGDLVLVPVNSGGSISIYAIDPANEGKTVWRSFLCDEPEAGAEPLSAINLTLDGSDLFVSCGMGVVFVLDPATGLVRFAKRYERVGTPDEFRKRSGWTVNRLNFNGWSSDIVIPYGRQIVCFSSDTETIEGFDRNSGEMIWRSEMTPIGHKVDYVLGVYDDILYVAGRETIVGYQLSGEGRMVWGADQLFDGKQSFGRGMLTPKGIYMPVENSIYHFSLPGKDKKAELVSRVEVKLGTDAPVGNLYSDGKRFWVHGANRLYALSPKK